MANPKLSPEMSAQIDKMLAEGHSNTAISNKTGVRYQAVVRRREMGGFKESTGCATSKPADPSSSTSETHEQDYVNGTWSINIPTTRICTEEQLVAHCKIDLEKWEIERLKFVVHEMGSKPPAITEDVDVNIRNTQGKVVDTETQKKWVRYSDKPVVTQLYSVTAVLRLRRFESTEGYIEENTKLRSQIAKMQISFGREREMAKRLARNHAGYDDLIDNMRALKDALGDFKLSPSIVQPAVARIKPAVKPGHTEDAVLLLSDTHFGEKHRREDVSGFQVCDSVILANRMGYVTAQAKDILSIQRAAYPIKTLYVWIGGDIGNGELHDSSKSNDLMMTEQVHFSYYMLKFAIEDLLSLTVPDKKTGVRVIENIVLLFTVGNHMRIDEKMPHDLQARRTFDWLIYQFLIEQFSKHPKVTIRKEMSPFIFETIRGWRHLFCHGMQIGYKNSPDAQAKSISEFMKLARALFDSPQWREENGLQGETFARVCGGDIHVPVSFPRYKGNGSLPGQNSLGVNWTLEPIPAGQQLFGVTENHLETFSYFIECTKVQRSEKDMNDYGRYAVEYLARTGGK